MSDIIDTAESDVGTELAGIIGGSSAAQGISAVGSLATNPIVLLLVIGGAAVAGIALLRAINPGGGTSGLRERAIAYGKKGAMLLV